MPDSKKPDTEQGKNELMSRFFSLEEKKLEVDAIREKNVAKELEVSERTSSEATRVAEKDLENTALLIRSSYGFKKLVVAIAGGIALVMIGVITFLVMQLKQDNGELLKTIFTYIYDIIKLMLGGAIGYLLKASRSGKGKEK